MRFFVPVVALLGLAACAGGASGAAGQGVDPATAALDPAAQACGAHATLDECLADVADRCYWGPNYAWPVAVDGDPCRPLEGMCQSELSPPFRPSCTVDPANEAACSAEATWSACVADTDHRCFWTPQMGIPCSPDGSWCPPPPHCDTAADCAPHCASSGPTISTPVYADCGCLTPPGGVCTEPAGAVSVPSCVARPACAAADVCSCLTGLGACTPGELPNVCVCTGV
ncbi:MAG TPA: hypothetical protein VF841_13605 [Anaeromyxobacter sp.]